MPQSPPPSRRAVAAAAISLLALLPFPSAAAATPEQRAVLERALADLTPDSGRGGLSVAQKRARIKQSLSLPDWPTSGRAVVVNVAEGRVRGLEDGRVVFESLAIVGKTTTRTPVMVAEAVSVTLNPTWTVPPSLRRKVKATVVQPGPRNPLGKVRVDMPNGANIYLHDTNEPQLFARNAHTFSHGCVRVADPVGLARWLLGEDRWERARAEETLKSWRTRRLALDEAVPVHIEYRTADVAPDGRVVFHKDPYGRLR